MLDFPALGGPAWVLFLALAGNATLPKAVREVVILSVGAASGAQYELCSHEVRARDAGLTEDKVRTIAARQRPADLSDAEAAAYDVTAALLSGRRVPNSTFEAAVREFEVQGAAELAYLAGCYQLIGALLSMFDVAAPAGPPTEKISREHHAAQDIDVSHGLPLRAGCRARWVRRGASDDALFTDGPIRLHPSSFWTDDLWFADQDDRHPRPNDGWWPLRAGTAAGRIVGGNLATLNLLQGTPYMPSLGGAVLLAENDSSSDPPTFARDLTSLLQLPDAAGVRGLVIGRFQQASRTTRPLLEQIVARQNLSAGAPVLANADFGHTNPLATIPIGGQIRRYKRAFATPT